MSERSVSKQKQGKRWYTVLAPEQFDRRELGKSPADEPEQLLDRTIETTLGELTDNSSENNNKLTFRITDYGSDQAYTEFTKHELTRDYLRSLGRRGASKVEAFVTELTTDDYRVQIQPVAFTTKKADSSQEKAIRRQMIDMVEEAASTRTFEDLVNAVVEGNLSSAIYNEAKTIYPLRRVEIQKLTLEAHPEEVAEEEETSVDVDAEDVDDEIEAEVETEAAEEESSEAEAEDATEDEAAEEAEAEAEADADADDEAEADEE